MAQKKATKKFEQRHLKDTLERRKGLKKTKQQQQLKARRKARKAEENGRDGIDQAAENDAKSQAKKQKEAEAEAIKNMSVDDFFQSGFEIPEMPDKKKKGGKRKRSEAVDEESDNSESESDAQLEEGSVPSDSDSGSESGDNMEEFKAQLDALAKSDPEFHKMLQKDEPEVFDDLDDLQLSEDDDEAEPKRKKQKKASADDSSSDEGAADSNELDMATLKKWQHSLTEQHSMRAAKEVVIAFRSAAQVSTSESEEKDFKYSVSDPEVYHQLLLTALKQIPEIFAHHLPVQESKSGKVHVPTDSKKFKTLAPLLRSQITGILHLLEHLSDASTLRLTLSSTLPLLPYLMSFKKLVRDVAKGVTEVWSTGSNTESTRIAAFLVMRRLIVIGDAGIRENVLKATYQGLVKSSRNTTIHTMTGINLMKNSAAELWGLSGSVAYTTAFTFIRSLAMHLRSSITNNSNESYKTVYNWQFVHSLDFWSRVLSQHAETSASALHPLIYPFVQVTLGALRLIPTATYFPLRFQLIRSLLRISLSTKTYIPLAAPLYEVLASAEMRKPPMPSTLKPLDFPTSIRAPAAYLRTRTYQDGVGEQVQELLSEFLVLWAKNIAFPELALPVTIMLRRWLKEVSGNTKKSAPSTAKGNKNTKVNSGILLLVQKIEANAARIEEKRSKVEFAPNNRRQVDAFLEDLSWEQTPLGAYVVGQRATRVEKEKVLEQSRKEDERRKTKEKAAAEAAIEEEDESESEEELSGDDDEDEEEDEE